MDGYVAGIWDVEEGDEGCGVRGVEDGEEGGEGVVGLVDGDGGGEGGEPFVFGLWVRIRGVGGQLVGGTGVCTERVRITTEKSGEARSSSQM